MQNTILPATSKDYPELITIWESSVRATHHFLTETDIEYYKPLILNEYFDQVNLFCIKTEGRITGFIGLDESMIQMLFILPEARGGGLGKALVTFAIEKHAANEVDVNEQNEQAVGFYKHLGFDVVERSEFDSAGKPYPILGMRLKGQGT